MPEDRSLEEFTEAPSDDTNDDGAETAVGRETSDEEGDAVTDEEGDVTPATTTSAWAGDGGRCGRCGDTVPRRWGDDGRLVCPACKAW